MELWKPFRPRHVAWGLVVVVVMFFGGFSLTLRPEPQSIKRLSVPSSDMSRAEAVVGREPSEGLAV